MKEIKIVKIKDDDGINVSAKWMFADDGIDRPREWAILEMNEEMIWPLSVQPTAPTQLVVHD